MVTYRFGPFRLFPDGRRLERDGAPMALTPKAFDLLLALVGHCDRALSKDELLSLVWPESIVEEAESGPAGSVAQARTGRRGDGIATIPRFGYRFTTA